MTFYITSFFRPSNDENYIEELSDILPGSNADSNFSDSIFGPIEASELVATLTLFDANQREIFGKIWRVDSNQGDLLFLLLNLDTGRIMYTGHQLCEIIMLLCVTL